ncbi:MAG: cupin domain-containing protein [Sandaracinus sp.]|jgi:1,2-dihydroxy-3-keto-5-methylthiopentene dioxygenase|nr:cupin domain-containing protein [Sandaracinus sp.]MCB9620423.1 cupin domain-containing protein [Sandaracinus sp.]MCB9624529.1 cupin domain-containing protein [Sandaracinus sp.]
MKATWIDDGTPIALDVLAAEGILYERLSTEPAGYQPTMDVLKTERGYVEQDVVELRPTTPNLDAICAKFDGEHLHDEDEVRFVLEGEGVFDIRSGADRWMRVLVEQGDLIVVPAQRWHRFELTEQKTIRCVRLFQDTSGWVPHYRDAAE